MHQRYRSLALSHRFHDITSHHASEYLDWLPEIKLKQASADYNVFKLPMAAVYGPKCGWLRRVLLVSGVHVYILMVFCHGNAFCITGPLWGESTSGYWPFVRGIHQWLLALCEGNPPVVTGPLWGESTSGYWPFVRGIHQWLLALCEGNPPVVTGPLWGESTSGYWPFVRGIHQWLLALCEGNPPVGTGPLWGESTSGYWPFVRGIHQWLLALCEGNPPAVDSPHKGPVMWPFDVSWNIFHITGPLWGNPPVNGGFPSEGPVMLPIDVFFDFSLNKLLNKQWSCQWFDTPWHPCRVFLTP